MQAVKIHALTAAECQNGGKGLRIEYGVHASPFGNIFVAVTRSGVCRAAFLDSGDIHLQLAELQKAWPRASCVENSLETRPVVDAMFGATTVSERKLALHIAGTDFQILVWQALLQIPAGTVASYKQVAGSIGRPQSSRAVGNAIGANPVAFLLPCHRVIRQGGALGGYRWGKERKQMIQKWERARRDTSLPQC